MTQAAMRTFLHHCHAASSLAYALLLGLVATFAVGTVTRLGGEVTELFGTVDQEFDRAACLGAGNPSDLCGPNRPPVAGDFTLTAAQAEEVVITLAQPQISDENGDSLIFTAVTPLSAEGQAQLDPQALTLTAFTAGSVDFAYTVSDGTLEDSGVITLSVVQPAGTSVRYFNQSGTGDCLSPATACAITNQTATAGQTVILTENLDLGGHVIELAANQVLRPRSGTVTLQTDQSSCLAISAPVISGSLTIRDLVINTGTGSSGNHVVLLSEVLNLQLSNLTINMADDGCSSGLFARGLHGPDGIIDGLTLNGIPNNGSPRNPGLDISVGAANTPNVRPDNLVIVRALEITAPQPDAPAVAVTGDGIRAATLANGAGRYELRFEGVSIADFGGQRAFQYLPSRNPSVSGVNSQLLSVEGLTLTTASNPPDTVGPELLIGVAIDFNCANGCTAEENILVDIQDATIDGPYSQAIEILNRFLNAQSAIVQLRDVTTSGAPRVALRVDQQSSGGDFGTNSLLDVLVFDSQLGGATGIQFLNLSANTGRRCVHVDGTTLGSVTLSPPAGANWAVEDRDTFATRNTLTGSAFFNDAVVQDLPCRRLP